MRLGPSPVSDRSPTSRSNKTNKQSTKNGNGVSVCRAKENQSISMIKYMNCVCLFVGNFTVKLINKIEIGKFSISTAHQSSQPFGRWKGGSSPYTSSTSTTYIKQSGTTKLLLYISKRSLTLAACRWRPPMDGCVCVCQCQCVCVVNEERELHKVHHFSRIQNCLYWWLSPHTRARARTANSFLFSSLCVYYQHNTHCRCGRKLLV